MVSCMLNPISLPKFLVHLTTQSESSITIGLYFVPSPCLDAVEDLLDNFAAEQEGGDEIEFVGFVRGAGSIRVVREEVLAIRVGEEGTGLNLVFLAKGGSRRGDVERDFFLRVVGIEGIRLDVEGGALKVS